MSRPETAIVVILRLLGYAAICAIPAIFLPYSWMNVIHQQLGLGDMPDAPIVSYLARSLSMFYAMFGVITVYVSHDLRRNWKLIRLLAIMSLAVGITLLGIDRVAEMPFHWTLVEGPFTICVGAAILQLQLLVDRRHARRSE